MKDKNVDPAANKEAAVSNQRASPLARRRQRMHGKSAVKNKVWNMHKSVRSDAAAVPRVTLSRVFTARY